MGSPFDALAGSVITSVQGIFGCSSISSVFTYSRAANGKLNAVAPFAIAAAISGGGAYATPEGPIAAGLLVRSTDIPLGPQKGDQVVILHSPAQRVDGTYKVQEIAEDKNLQWAELQLRLISQ